MLDSEESCSRAGVLKRIPEKELCTPEEFLAARRRLASDSKLAPVAFREIEGQHLMFPFFHDRKEEVIATETTSLLMKGLDV